MASFDVLVRRKGFQEIQVFFNETSKRFYDLTVPLKKAQLLMIRSINNNFQASGRPLPWAPLKMATLRRKILQGYSSKPLIRTGNLKRSITGKIEEKNKLIMGTSVTYGRIHQYGGGHIPKRTYLLFQDRDIERINQLIVDYVTNVKKFTA